jgi:serine/threonine-protein kinase
MSQEPNTQSAEPVGPRAAAAGRRLAGCRLIRSLGKGGLGEVYEGLTPDGRRVAIKSFLIRDDNQGLLASAFVREANLGLRLDHPDIVKVLDSGCDGDYAYLVMEFVPGHDLCAHVSRDRQLPLPGLLQVLERVARALAAAHAIHVVHRDIKPGNVLVHAPTDTVKVSDFGLARLGDAFRSRTGIISGTPGYMSPEQLSEGPVGPRSDLYSLGVMMFELLTGRLPHEAESLGQLLVLAANHTAPLVSTHRDDLPADLTALVAELLERQPDRRPADARVVADRLAHLRGELARCGQAWAAGPKSRA